ncbi:MAG: hypothetical protein CM1200mP22_32900 [Dehalococcoidia bacterium]|nr:MAG: hypothetical protein CM1200mP22_32900 [Dehalococcoidia bacterium]
MVARMFESGEDPLFIVRRLVILAAEDVGLADPQALSIAVAAQQAVHFLGCLRGVYRWPKLLCIWLRRQKSNSTYAALNQAMEDVGEKGFK